MTVAEKETPAQRAKNRRNPAIQTPPPAIKGVQASIKDITLVAAGTEYQIGGNIEGDTPWEMTMEGAATLTLPVRSPDKSLLKVLTDETLLQEAGVTVAVDDVVYVLRSVAGDETGLYTLTFEDQVAWRLRQFKKFLAMSRKQITRAGFVLRLVNEASRPPLAPIVTFIPEVKDRQSIAAPTSTG